MTANAIKPTDVEIMMFLDGELEGEEAKVVESYLEGNEEAASVAASIGQLSELVRGSVELEADAAEDKLAGLWAGIDSAISSNGVSKDAPSVTAAATPSVAPIVSIQAKAEERATEALVEKAGWFGGWQSHVMAGALAAAAALLIMYTQRADTKAPAGVAERQNSPNPNGQVGTRPNQPSIVPVVLRSNAPEVEELEVYDGSGVIMTVASDAESDDAASAVIWISSDTDLVADPI